MRVILYRHGPAAARDPERWPDDAVRPLTSMGAQLTRATAGGLARVEPGIQDVLSSPSARATQSARVLADVLGTGEVEVVSELGAGCALGEMLRFLSARVSDRNLVLVGHEPDLGVLAGYLLFGSPMGLPLKPSGACSIRFDGMAREGTGRLRWFMTPKLLRYASTSRRRA